MVALVGVVGACQEADRSITAFRGRRRLKRAAKAALRQHTPPISRHAVLNPAELKAKRY
jgi:hypothetical protein